MNVERREYLKGYIACLARDGVRTPRAIMQVFARDLRDSVGDLVNTSAEQVMRKVGDDLLQGVERMAQNIGTHGIGSVWGGIMRQYRFGVEFNSKRDEE